MFLIQWLKRMSYLLFNKIKYFVLIIKTSLFLKYVIYHYLLQIMFFLCNFILKN